MLHKFKPILIKAMFAVSFNIVFSPQILIAEEKAVARVNGHAIMSDMLQLLSASRKQGPLSELNQNQVILLENLITTELLFQAAKQAKLDDNRQISLELELAHKTLLSQLYVKRFMDQLEINDSDLLKAYQAQSAQIMVRMELWNFNTEDEALTFLGKTINDETNIDRAGEQQPWQHLENYPFATLPEAPHLSAGRWLPFPVKGQSGWQVWRCLEKSSIPKPSFEAAKDELRQELANQGLLQHIETLRSEADIQLLLQE